MYINRWYFSMYIAILEHKGWVDIKLRASNLVRLSSKKLLGTDAVHYKPAHGVTSRVTPFACSSLGIMEQTSLFQKLRELFLSLSLHQDLGNSTISSSLCAFNDHCVFFYNAGLLQKVRVYFLNNICVIEYIFV